jgi:hypothetical protein
MAQSWVHILVCFVVLCVSEEVDKCFEVIQIFSDSMGTLKSYSNGVSFLDIFFRSSVQF